MSTLYLGSDPGSLADQLADDLGRRADADGFFTPTTIVVPNRYLRKWLRLYLARKLDVAIHLDFQYLEDALWNLLRAVDPSPLASRPEAIDENMYRLMVLSVLLDENDPELGPLQRYVQRGQALSRLACRRAWFLAERLGVRLQDYEYNRQDALIQRWLAGKLGLDNEQTMERAQRAVFLHITREPDGKRALLNRLDEKTFKTFPQYALELMTQNGSPLPPGEGLGVRVLGLDQSATQDPHPLPLSRGERGENRRVVHFFGFTQVSELHARVIAWLGKTFDVRFHHLNVLSSRYGGDPAATAQALREPAEAEAADPGRELLRLWGRAGAESLWLVSLLQSEGGFAPTLLAPPTASETTVLGRLRSALLWTSRPEEEIREGEAPAEPARQEPRPPGSSRPSVQPRLAQDTSLQIVGCPGVTREVETVYNSILHNLNADPSLRQTDVAVLVTDMPKYRAALQAAFERPPKRLQYNMVDFSAAGISTFGQAVLGMLDLALESFSRSRVFQVILNPCFLARLGVDRAQAMTWLEWAEQLGIHQGWDADEKAQQGYARSPFYAWQLGLQRLRLGRFMEVESEEADQPAPRFGHVIPFADLESGDREQLDALCRAVEGLLPTLARLRSAQMSGDRWAKALERLSADFLEVPAERPEEAAVRTELLAALQKLSTWDALREGSARGGMPLALVREYVQGQLEVLAGNRGEYLIGGVTIAALQPMRPVPFAVVYVLGLGEDLFPGSNALSSFDLRGARRIPGDVRPAEARLYDFLATILSARQKLYLLYNNRDLQKERDLLPGVPLVQLQRYLGQHVLKADFAPVQMPAHAADLRYLDPAQQPAYQDVLVQHRDADRCLALAAAQADHRLELAAGQEAEWSSRRCELDREFAIPAAAEETKPASITVTVSELRRFLVMPAQASLRRHLRLEEEDEQTVEDDEPLVTTQQAGGALVRQTLQRLVGAAARTGVQPALAGWQDGFANAYADAQLRSRVPEDAFGEIDKAAILHDLQERIHGAGLIEAFLRSHAGMTPCGPVLLGASRMPLGARVRFPALRLRPGHELPDGAGPEIRIVGSTNFAWQAPGRFEMLIVTSAKEFDGRELHTSMLEPMLFYLALLANSEPNADGMSSHRWLADRDFRLHVAHREGIVPWDYPRGCITSAEALHYLATLTRDFLDPTQFDLLPFDVLVKKRELLAAMHDDFDTQITPEHYCRALDDAIADVRENAYRAVKIPLLVEMVGAEAPADALAKVQRRFRLLDRAAARNRRKRVN
jgi:exonuclease V gamma subunit